MPASAPIASPTIISGADIKTQTQPSMRVNSSIVEAMIAARHSDANTSFLPRTTNAVAKPVANGNSTNSTPPIEPDRSLTRKKPPSANAVAVRVPTIKAAPMLPSRAGSSGSGSLKSVLIGLASGWAEARGDALIDDLSLVRDAGWTNHVVVHVDRECAVFDQQREKRGDVSRVELAGVNWNCRGQICWRENRDAVAFDGLIRLAQCAVAAGCTGELDDDRAALHSVHGFFGNQQRRAASGHLRRCDHDGGSPGVLGN